MLYGYETRLPFCHALPHSSNSIPQPATTSLLTGTKQNATTKLYMTHAFKLAKTILNFIQIARQQIAKNAKNHIMMYDTNQCSFK